MDFNNPEVAHLATRVYAQDLVLRMICLANPQWRPLFEDAAGQFENISLFTELSDSHRQAVLSHFRVIISGQPSAT